MSNDCDSVRTRDGLTLSLRHWPATNFAANRGVVCIVQGLGEHINRYERLAKTLSGCGWFVVGYDQRGHGNSAGKHNLVEIADACRREADDCTMESLDSDYFTCNDPSVLID